MHSILVSKLFLVAFCQPLTSFLSKLPDVKKIHTKHFIIFLLQLTPAYEPCFLFLLNLGCYIPSFPQFLSFPIPHSLSIPLSLLLLFLGFSLALLLASNSFSPKISTHQRTRSPCHVFFHRHKNEYILEPKHISTFLYSIFLFICNVYNGP